jgi:hypothetical protein
LTHAVCQVHLDVVVAVDQSAVELIANVLAAVELIAIELVAVVGAVAVQRVTAALTGTEVTVVAEKRGTSRFRFSISNGNFWSLALGTDPIVKLEKWLKFVPARLDQ